MSSIIGTIIHCVGSFLWFCSQPVYFIRYIFETNYELISVVFGGVYTCLECSGKVCYLLIYGLASMVEYILFSFMSTKEPLMIVVNSVIYLLKIIIRVPVFIVKALLYVPVLVTSLSNGIVELATLITNCYNVFLNSARGLLQTSKVVFEYFKTEGVVWYDYLETLSTQLLTIVQTLVGALAQLIYVLWDVLITLLATIEAAICDCEDALCSVFGNSATFIVNHVTKICKHLNQEIIIAFSSISDLFLTSLELASYMVIFAAVIILLVTVSVKVYLMYSNAVNSANSLMSFFRSSLLFGSGGDNMQQRHPAPPVRPERFAQEGNVSDAESDDSLMNNVRNRVLRRPQERHREEPGLHPSQSSQVNTQTRNNEEHRPGSSGEHSRTQTTRPYHSSTTNRLTDAAKLAKQLEEERDRLLCVVCQDKVKNILIFPCKHLCVCEDCVDGILNRGSKKCPLCRGRISSYLEVYA
ncbi:uncharacterized protein [Asterias amurensis]|uniref:uncharacterized protein n=1 Tax=Asterias amurensis TaxID=7602 RepID=UPI003AB71EFD